MGDAFLQLGEKLKANAKRPNIYGYTPHDKQLKFHKSTKKRRLYIGGNRSGKTTGGIIEDIWTALGEHPYRPTPEPPIRGRIVTTDFINGIEKNILPELSRWCPIGRLKGGSWHTAYDKQERVLNFSNGSFIELMSYDQDLDKFASVSRHFVHMDEEPPKDIFKECTARLIDTGGDVWLTMTPLDGMTWVYDDLYEPGIAGDNPNIDVITVEMLENPHLNEGEANLYLSDLDEDEAKARGKGEFIQLGGLIYKMFNIDMHVVDEFVPPLDWLWVCSLDHGLNNPTSWLWHAVDTEGYAYTFHEQYKKGMMINEHAKSVLEQCGKFGRMPDYFVGDPSIRNTSPITGTSIHQEYASAGIPIVLGNNDVKAGIAKVSRYLKPQPIADTGITRPHLYVTKNCSNTIKEYTRYRWRTYVSKKTEANNNPQEVPHKKDDHSMDSTRYFIMSQPDLMADMPLTAAEARNHLNLPSGVDPATGRTMASRPPETNGWTDEFAGESNDWAIDEHLGGMY